MNTLKGKKNTVGLNFAGIILGAGFFLSFVFVSAVYCQEQGIKTKVYKSALIWRADEKGGYSMPRAPAGQPYIISEPIIIKDGIDTITVSWKFRGKVTLELSFDGGVSFMPVVNGVPVDCGNQKPITNNQMAYAKGQIKWRAEIGADSELTEVRITYIDTADTEASFGQPELSGFKFRKKIEIKNPSKTELFNYQVKINIKEKTGADFKDARFTAEDGQTLFPYYLESVTADNPNQQAVFWVKIPQIPVEGVYLYIYYGNPRAEDLSSGQDVFDFFDDFTRETLDAKKWEFYPYLDGKYNLFNSLLELAGAKIVSKDYQVEDGIIEYKAKTEIGGEIRFIARENKNDPFFTQLVYSSSYAGAEHAIAAGNIVKVNDSKPMLSNMFYNYRILARKRGIDFQRYSHDYEKLEAAVSFKNTGGLEKGYIGMEAGGDVNGYTVTYYDWIRARKFVSPEPFVGALGKPELTNLAYFFNTVLSEDGSVVLKDENAEGYYKPPVITAACPINTVSVTADMASVMPVKTDKQLEVQANIAKESKLEEIKIEYSVFPVIRAKNIYISGATGGQGEFILNDIITMEWDNSSNGDNNAGVTLVEADLRPLAASRLEMFDDGPKGGHRDKKARDGIYTCVLALPAGISWTGNARLIAVNQCGSSALASKIFKVETNTRTVFSRQGQ